MILIALKGKFAILYYQRYNDKLRSLLDGDQEATRKD